MSSEVLDSLRTLRESVANDIKKDPRYLTLSALEKSIAEISSLLSSAGAATGIDADKSPPTRKKADIKPSEAFDGRAQIAVDNMFLRDAFINEVPCLVGVQLDEPERWKSGKSIFSIDHRGVEYYPAFQFEDGHPRPSIKPLLESLPAFWTPWQKAFWFVSANGWLDGEPPMLRLDSFEEVVSAAKRENQELIG